MECTAGFGAGATAGSGYHDLLIRQPFVVTTVEVGHRRSRLPLMRMPGDGSSARRGGATVWSVLCEQAGTKVGGAMAGAGASATAAAHRGRPA